MKPADASPKDPTFVCTHSWKHVEAPSQKAGRWSKEGKTAGV
jgi:hypothetical protein